MDSSPAEPIKPVKASVKIRRDLLDKAMMRAKTNNNRLSKAVGVHPSQIARWRQRDFTPKAINLMKLCLALGVTPAEICGLESLPGGDPRSELILFVRHTIGDAEADILDVLRNATDDEKATALRVVKSVILRSTANSR